MIWSKNGHKAEKHQGISCKYVFTAGVDYYTFEHDYDIPEMRMRFAQRYLNEMQINCDKEYLKDYCEAVKNCINVKGGETIQLDKILMLTGELDKRLDWIFEPDSLYRFASVVYFDLREDIKEYDISYQHKKIDRFKKKGLRFFLKELIPDSEKLQNLSEDGLKTYMSQLREEKEKQSKLIQSLKGKKS
jgi:hypothetical protein